MDYSILIGLKKQKKTKVKIMFCLYLCMADLRLVEVRKASLNSAENRIPRT